MNLDPLDPLAPSGPSARLDPSARSDRSVLSDRWGSPDNSRRWGQQILPGCFHPSSGRSARCSADVATSVLRSPACHHFQQLSGLLRRYFNESPPGAQLTFPWFSGRPKTQQGNRYQGSPTFGVPSSTASLSYCLDRSSGSGQLESPRNDNAKSYEHNFKRSSQLSRPGMPNSSERGG